MPKLDPFSAQVVQLVRNMPDEAILALVREKLGAASTDEPVAANPLPVARRRAVRGKPVRKVAPKVTARPATKAAAPAAKAAPRPTTPKKARPSVRRVSPQRLKVLAAVERVVKASRGLSASEVARATGIGQVRVATALRELKHAKRVFQGGDRRFARYAGDQRVADQASVTARRTASGPIVKKRPTKG
jgi:hypothetical protein